MTTNIKLMVVFTKLIHSFHNRLAKNLEDLGMNPSMYPMLAHLSEVDQAKTQELGQVALISSGTITHTVNKMIKEGLVEKQQDYNDKRVYWIQITPKGRSAFDQVHQDHMAYLDQLLEPFSEEEKVAFIQEMKHFGKTIDKQ